MKALIRTLVVVAAVAGLTACAGEDGSRVGVFVDASGVEGLRYQTATQTGTTDSNGSFRYIPGEQVIFYVGSMEIGRAAGAERITAFDLAGIPVPAKLTDLDFPTPGGRSLNQAINLSTFLQTIDDDANHTNGIFVPLALRTMQSRSSVKFVLPVSTFRTHPTLLTYMGQARTAGVWGGSRPIKNSGYAADALYRGLGLRSEAKAKSEVRFRSAGQPDSVTTYYYDGRGQLVEELFLDPASETYQKTVTNYDDAGNRVSVKTYLAVDTLLNEVVYYYDANGYEIKSETIQSGWGVRWAIETARDISGNPVEIKTYDSGVQTGRTVSTYDAFGLLTKSEFFDGSGQLSGGNEYEYGRDSQRIAMRQFDSTRTLSLVIESSYNKNGELIQEINSDGLGQLLGVRSITRDSTGNIVREEGKDSSGMPMFSNIFEYDVAGRESTVKVYDGSGTLTTTTALTYDNNGRLVNKRIVDVRNGVVTEQLTAYLSVSGWSFLFNVLDGVV